MQENEAAGDAPGTPDEKSFVDDDGTAYEWDPVARRFAEVGAAKPAAAAAQAAAADAAFDQEQQTFAFEAEEIPAMPEAEASCPELPPLAHALLWRQQAVVPADVAGFYHCCVRSRLTCSDAYLEQ